MLIEYALFLFMIFLASGPNGIGCSLKLKIELEELKDIAPLSCLGSRGKNYSNGFLLIEILRYYVSNLFSLAKLLISRTSTRTFSHLITKNNLLNNYKLNLKVISIYIHNRGKYLESYTIKYYWLIEFILLVNYRNNLWAHFYFLKFQGNSILQNLVFRKKLAV